MNRRVVRPLPPPHTRPDMKAPLLAITFLLSAIATPAYSDPAPEDVSDPSRVRPWTQFDPERPRYQHWDYFFEREPAISLPSFPEPFGPVEREVVEEDIVRLSFDQRDPGSGFPLPGVEVRIAGPDQTIPLPEAGEGALARAASMALVWNDPAFLEATAGQSKIPITWLNPATQQPWSEASLADLAIPDFQSSVFRANLERSPLLKVHLRVENLVPGQFLWQGLPRLFDARTHVQTSAGGGGNGGAALQLFSSSYLPLRHDTPIRVVQDIAVDPVEMPFPLEPGHQVNFEDRVRVQLLSIEKGTRTSFLTEKPEDEKSTRTLRFNRKTDATTFLFEVDPPAYRNSLEMVVTFKDGKEKANTTNSGLVFGSRDEIESLRLRFYRQHRRLAFDLERVPGLPNPHSKITDLLDITLENVTARSVRDIGKILERTVQLKWVERAGPRPAPPEDFYPKTWDTVTGRELLETLRLHWPEGSVIVDPKACELRVNVTESPF